MEAKELMVYDWVDVCIDGEFRHTQLRYAGDIMQLESHEIQPIPLTEEILKVNGYHNHGAMFYGTSEKPTMAKYNESEWILSYGKAGNKAFLVSLYISDVHELQHALRLCGLNELANNFKVGQI